MQATKTKKKERNRNKKNAKGTHQGNRLVGISRKPTWKISLQTWLEGRLKRLLRISIPQVRKSQKIRRRSMESGNPDPANDGAETAS